MQKDPKNRPTTMGLYDYFDDKCHFDVKFDVDGGDYPHHNNNAINPASLTSRSNFFKILNEKVAQEKMHLPLCAT